MDTFKDLTKTSPLDKGKHVILFGAEWCGPCKPMKETIIQHIIPKTKDISYWYVDMMTCDTRLYDKFEITTLPTIVCIIDNVPVTFRELGDLRKYLGIHA